MGWSSTTITVILSVIAALRLARQSRRVPTSGRPHVPSSPMDERRCRLLRQAYVLDNAVDQQRPPDLGRGPGEAHAGPRRDALQDRSPLRLLPGAHPERPT